MVVVGSGTVVVVGVCGGLVVLVADGGGGC